MITLVTYCLGHIVKPLKECEDCKQDENNKYCRAYNPHNIYIINVKDDRETNKNR